MPKTSFIKLHDNVAYRTHPAGSIFEAETKKIAELVKLGYGKKMTKAQIDKMMKPAKKGTYKTK